MAYKPSQRRNRSYAGSDLDIRPIMNLMVCLIPILLAGVEYVKNAQLEVKLPPSTSASGGAGKNETPNKEKEKKLQLTVAIYKDGFHMNALNTKLLSKPEKGKPSTPTVPLLESGDYDFAGLRAKVKEIKAGIEGQGFQDGEQIIITALNNIPYEIFVKVQDVVMYEKVGEEFKDIFPVVTIGVALTN